MKTKHIFLLATIFLLTRQISAQDEIVKQSAWQQKVNHEIHAELDVKNNMLRCYEMVEYFNHSDSAISYIPFHIWPNAFSAKNTAYGKEALINGNEKFLHAKKDVLGYLDSLNFEAEGKKLDFHYQGKEIVWVKLPGKLSPGSSIAIQTPFRVKIPALFSRMGVSDGLFSITQWYPKPAVLDANGWNVFEYREQGEYYSEFGTYNVFITLYSDFVVGATGKLQNEDELEWMTELAEKTAEKRDGKSMKELHYVQENVSDFAWFASRDFRVGEKMVSIADGRQVKAYALVHEDSKASVSNVLENIEKALTYYGKRVGNYPYDYCTAVIGKLTAAGGMEYPMITICGDGSAGTVIHEVGHNWFQGMLGSQERRYPWMDESINTFYQWQAEGEVPDEWQELKNIKPKSPYLAYRLSRDLGVFQAGNIHSEKFQQTNYGTIVYASNPLRFQYLQEYLGKVMLDSCMKNYFKKWQFRHPLPGDMQQIFEEVSGENLNWFFKDLIGDNEPEASVRSVKRNGDDYTVQLKNRSNFKYPIKLEWKNETKTSSTWVRNADTTVKIQHADYVRLNPSAYLTEGDIENNESRTRGILKKTGKLKVGFPTLYHRGENRIWILPNVFTTNLYDGYTPGVMISNFSFPRHKWEWWLMPSYGIKSKNIVGAAGIERNVWFKGRRITLAEFKTIDRVFDFKPFTTSEKNMMYNHLEVTSTFYFKRNKPWIQDLVSLSYLRNDISVTGAIGGSGLNNNIASAEWRKNIYKKAAQSYINMLGEFINNTNLGFANNPYSAGFGTYNLLRFSAEQYSFIPYKFFHKKQMGLVVKSYLTGIFMVDETISVGTAYRPVVSGANGSNDYGFRQLMVNRSSTYTGDNFWGNRLLATGQGVRMGPNITAQRYAGGLSIESSFIPGVPLNLFFDAAMAVNWYNTDLYWAGGVNYCSRINGVSTFEINLPLVYSSNFNPLVKGLKWYDLTTFKVRFILSRPMELARMIYQ